MRHRKAKAKTELRNSSDIQKLRLSARVRHAIRKIAGFPDPAGVVPEVEETHAALLETTSRIAALESLLSAERKKKKVLVSRLSYALNKLAIVVDGFARGSAALIAKTGFRFWHPGNAPRRPLPARVKGVKVTTSNRSGTVHLCWKFHYRLSYMVFMATDPNDTGDWRAVASSVKTKAIVTGLVPGQCYWFRVVATGAAGTSPPSDPVGIYAP